ncbi:MAG: acyl-ACP--UDP-N-acetylglucosamine O-acyltransferase [Phycisphaerae bacterium]|nr:acyl-ACP--UDP-N-acetylglucosamine O-acyltransferase [Phycisphaerae bacterium]
MPRIHPSAVVEPSVELSDDVQIGPGCVVTGAVKLGSGVRLIGHATICGELGPVEVGAGTTVYPGACVGFGGQDAKFKPGMASAGVRIGAGVTLRESATVHAATKPDRPTTVGDRVYMMVSSHVGHDATVENDVTMVNAVALGGHAHVAERAILGGSVVVHQFGRVGRMAFISGGSAFSSDVPPFCVGAGRNNLTGVNLVGLRRAGVPREHITLVRQAFRDVFRRNLMKSEALARLAELGVQCPLVLEMRDFVATGKRTIAPYRNLGRASGVAAPAEAAEV